MARLTTEDCNDKVCNRFELVALASQRAKVISSGGMITVERNNDKDCVIALREIANGNIKPSDLRAAMIRSYQGKSYLSNLEDIDYEITDENQNVGYTENTDLYVNQEENDLEGQGFEDSFEDNFQDNIDTKI